VLPAYVRGLLPEEAAETYIKGLFKSEAGCFQYDSGDEMIGLFFLGKDNFSSLEQLKNTIASGR
jgi:hypothetical protein